MRRPAVPAGVRVYVVAPLGGRLERLEVALAAIEADRADAPASVRTVLLGGLVDGPDAPALVLRAMKLAADEDVAVLVGPAEQALGAEAQHWPGGVPASVEHWLARLPREGAIGDYGFANGRLMARGRVVAGEVLVLEGDRRRALL